MFLENYDFSERCMVGKLQKAFKINGLYIY